MTAEMPDEIRNSTRPGAALEWVMRQELDEAAKGGIQCRRPGCYRSTPEFMILTDNDPGEPLSGLCLMHAAEEGSAKAETVPAPPAHVDLDGTAAAWHHAAIAATAEIARLTEIRDQAIANLQAAMGDAPEARIAGRKAATWAWATPRMILNRDSLEAKYGPEEIATHLRASKPSRPFKLTGGAS